MVTDHVGLGPQLLAHGEGELVLLRAPVSLMMLLFSSLWSHSLSRPPRYLLVVLPARSRTRLRPGWQVIHRDPVLHELFKDLLCRFA